MYQNERNGKCPRGENRSQLLGEIQRTDFMLNDLQLYLDNHPECCAALEDFNQLSRISMELKDRYQQVYGPIINNGYQSSGSEWQWVNEPWPWQRDFMTRG